MRGLRSALAAVLIGFLAGALPAQATYYGAGPRWLQDGGTGATALPYWALVSPVTVTCPLNFDVGFTANTSLKIGGTGATALKKLVLYTPSLTGFAINAQSGTSHTYTVTGVTKVTDRIVAINAPSLTAGTGISTPIISPTTNNSLVIAGINYSTATKTTATGTYRILVATN